MHMQYVMLTHLDFDTNKHNWTKHESKVKSTSNSLSFVMEKKENFYSHIEIQLLK